MTLRSKNTQWVFILTSGPHHIENRHFKDIIFGFLCLAKSGIDVNNQCTLVIDGNHDKIEKDPYYQAIMTDSCKILYTISDLPSHLNSLNRENIVVFITGHGDEYGLPHSTIKLSPDYFYSLFKNLIGVRHVIMYFGQCCSGVFNHMLIGGKHKNTNNPEIIAIGATNLYSSLSIPLKAEFSEILNFNWVGNLFLYHLFLWISSPSDIDGDGKLTVIDSFKYAGINSNRDLAFEKQKDFIRMQNLAIEIAQSKQDSEDIEAKKVIYEKLLGLHYIHQEPWILNSIPAHNIEF